MTPKFLTTAALSGIPHGFFGRDGGVSVGDVAGLQAGLGADDDAEAVAENRRRIVKAVLPEASLATVYQIHSAKVVRYLTAPGPDDRPEADAMVTDRPGLLLGIVTADCAPVLLADSHAGVIGAAHAGWKGAVGGVCQQTVEAMEKLGAHVDNIVAAVGPCIAQKSYEVDSGFLDNLMNVAPENDRFFAAGRDGNHYQFDLAAYVAAALAGAGLRRVEIVGRDTYAESEDFFSYRRACHRAEPHYGRQMSVIGLPPG